MAVSINITVEGVKEMSQRLLTTAGAMEDFTVPLQGAAQLLLKTFDMNFDTEGDLLEQPWAPRTSGGDWPLLVKTGAMRSSFSHTVDPAQAVITNWAPYFKYHQSSAPRKKLPRRVMMKLTEPLRTAIVKEFQSYIMGIINKK